MRTTTSPCPWATVALYSQGPVGVLAPAYTPRDPMASVLYAVVREHVETFRVGAARLRDGQGLPRFVDAEFAAFLRCGFLAGGFARFRCDACRTERLVALSFKGRGFCPSCGGRRMAERAARLVDHVLPDVPVRQWVLTLPHRLRYLLAWRHDLCRAVARILHRAVERHLRAWARQRGLRHARGGSVAVLQRFGGSLNLNVHVHALVLDWVFTRKTRGPVQFHPAPAPSETDVAEVLASLVPAVHRLLRREGIEDEEVADPFAEAEPLLAGWAAASVEGMSITGGERRRPTRLGEGRSSAAPTPSACHARWEDFDLHAGVRIPAGQRDRLERVCRYALRPPLAGDRLHLTGTGDIALEFRRPWSDGTTHLVFAPVAFLARLAVLVPRPRVNLVLYYGVLALRAAWRAAVVPTPSAAVTESPESENRQGEGRGWRWADLMRRVFAVDVLACPGCNGRLRLVAVLDTSVATARILQHVGLPTEVPKPAPARASPAPEWVD